MAYSLAGQNATVASWGSANQYSTILAAIDPASARVSLVNNGVDITALGEQFVTELPGLTSGTAVIGGYAGSTAYLGNVCGVSNSAGATTYQTHCRSIEITLGTTQVHDITEFNSGTPPTVMAYRPDIFAASARWTCLVDTDTAIAKPSIYGDTLPTLVFTYGTSATLTMSGAVRTMNVQLVTKSMQLVTYAMNSSSTVVSSGGIFGTYTFGGTLNNAPLWSAGGAAAGAIQFNMISGGARKVTAADSFYRSMTIRAVPAAPVGFEANIQLTGALAIT